MINYNFKDIEKYIFQLKDIENLKNPDIYILPGILSNIRDELNKIFPGTLCKEVKFTDNTDGMFFGMYIKPYLTDALIENVYIVGIHNFPTTDYSIELDSKLFDLSLGLTTPQITALILHDIGKLTNTVKPILDIRAYLNIYAHENGLNLCVINKGKFFEVLFAYAITQTTRNLTSIFKMDCEELIADEFVQSIGYNRQLEEGYDRLLKSTETKSEDDQFKFKPLRDALLVYENIENNKRVIKNYIMEILPLTGSCFEKELICRFQEQFNYIRLNSLTESECLKIIKESKFIRKIQLGGLRAVEDDLYEYNIRIKNVDDELEAIDILRNINYRINLIDDYIEYNELSESEANRWEDVKRKFINLREQLAKTEAYKKKMYGLYVQYPVSNGRY